MSPKQIGETTASQSSLSSPQTCSEMVGLPPHYFHSFPCSRRAVETVNGKGYCKQHAKIKRRHLAFTHGDSEASPPDSEVGGSL